MYLFFSLFISISFRSVSHNIIAIAVPQHSVRQLPVQCNRMEFFILFYLFNFISFHIILFFVCLLATSNFLLRMGKQLLFKHKPCYAMLYGLCYGTMHTYSFNTCMALLAYAVERTLFFPRNVYSFIFLVLAVLFCFRFRFFFFFYTTYTAVYTWILYKINFQIPNESEKMVRSACVQMSVCSFVRSCFFPSLLRIECVTLCMKL